jgi:hypothetical protein
MTMTTAAAATATPTSPVQIVPMTIHTAEVRLAAGGSAAVSIGRVQSTNGRWFWQHRDGEQSSPIAASRADAAYALAEYHRAFKPQAAARPTPVRRLLFS